MLCCRCRPAWTGSCMRPPSQLPSQAACPPARLYRPCTAEDHASTKFTYKMSPIQIVVTEQPKQLYRFLTAVCAVIGGVFTVAGVPPGSAGADTSLSGWLAWLLACLYTGLLPSCTPSTPQPFLVTCIPLTARCCRAPAPACRHPGWHGPSGEQDCQEGRPGQAGLTLTCQNQGLHQSAWAGSATPDAKPTG